MAVATAGNLFIEPLAGGFQPTPIASFIGVIASPGDATGGNNVITYTLAFDWLWVLRVAAAQHSVATALTFTFSIDSLAFGQAWSRSKVTDAGAELAGDVFEFPRWLMRPAGTTNIRIRFIAPNVDGVSFNGFVRLWAFPKTALRDFSAAQLLGFVL